MVSRIYSSTALAEVASRFHSHTPRPCSSARRRRLPACSLRSRTAASGRLSDMTLHVVPESGERHTPSSPPAYSVPVLAGSTTQSLHCTSIRLLLPPGPLRAAHVVPSKCHTCW